MSTSGGVGGRRGRPRLLPDLREAPLFGIRPDDGPARRRNGSVGPAPAANRRIGDAHMNERTLSKQSDQCRSKWLRLQCVNGTGSRATPWFEGAQPPSKVLTKLESAHLGKPRRFLRRSAPFSKVRTKNCASSGHSASRSFMVARFMAALADFALIWLILHPSAFILPTSVASLGELSHNGGLNFASPCWKVTSHASQSVAGAA